jgi:hypothetical protein
MVAAIIFAIIVVVVIPVGFLMSTSIAAGALGALLKINADRQNESSELLDTNY